MVERLRKLSWLEGLSLLVLVLVAMPLKYLGDMPIYVRITGSVHGFFFASYCIYLGMTAKRLQWSVDKALVYFVSALIPFGMVMVDKRLKAEESLI